MPPQDERTTTKASISEGDNVSIQSLTERAVTLNQNVDFWNNLMIWALILTAVSTIAVVATTRLALVNAKKLADVQADLVKVKDDQLTRDLQGKEQKIAEARERAGTANRDAGLANEAAAQANERAKKLEKEAAELKKQNLDTERKLEAERRTRLELEKSLNPRSLAYIGEQAIFTDPSMLASVTGLRGKSNIDPLKPFAGTNVILQYLPDAEASRAAGSIASIIKAAGWNVTELSARPELIGEYFDGVVVWAHRPRTPAGSFPNTEQERAKMWSDGAAASVVLFLRSNNWQADLRGVGKGEVPINTVKIMVGFKPNPYFQPQVVKDFRKNEDAGVVRQFLERLVDEAIKLKNSQ